MMFQRFIAFVALIWILGFVWFGLTLPAPAADDIKTDGIVVLTGGEGRVERGLRLMEQKAAVNMLISGVGRDVQPEELAALYQRDTALFDCCIKLGRRAVDTRSNAIETERWASQQAIGSIRLITSDWHMRRARLELDMLLPRDINIVQDAVPTAPSFSTLVKEYHKFVLRLIASVAGI